MRNALHPKSSVVVTGAGSGLGREIVLHYARQAWCVGVTDRDLGSAEQVLAEARALGAEGFAMHLDVTRVEDFEALDLRINKEWGRLDVLVNNAGIPSAGPLLETDLAQWERVLDINLLGVVRGCRVIGSRLAKQGQGHVVNIASFAGLAGAPGLASYGVAKAAVVALSESLRAEMHASGVGVTVVCPSFFRTRLLDRLEQGGASLRKGIQSLMDQSEHDAAAIAAMVADAVRRRQFLLLPHRATRHAWWMKRWFPEWYFRRMLAMVSRRRARLESAQ